MIKLKQDLEKKLEKIFEKITINNDKCQKIYDAAYKMYNIPKSLTSDYVCFRISISEASEFILFCLSDVINKEKVAYINLKEFFNELELSTYSNEKFFIDKLQFPIKIKMLQIEDDQWIGKTDVNFIMKLRDAQMINYNINAQRTMQSIIKNGVSIYKITLNEKAVDSIKEHLSDGSFIPNTITLNIPQDEFSSFDYDEKNSELIIHELSHFDILDGYHRYIAVGKVKDIDPSFNYNFELRIVNFSEDKSKSFIFQEDQKTKMSKLDSKSFDMNNAANIIVNRLNENSIFNLKGEISRNKGIIDFGHLADIIDYLFVKRGYKYRNKNIMIMSIMKELMEDFNTLTEYNERYLTERYSLKQLYIIVSMFYIYRNKNKENMCHDIDNLINNMDQIDSNKFKKGHFSGSILKEVENVNRVVNNYDV